MSFMSAVRRASSSRRRSRRRSDVICASNLFVVSSGRLLFRGRRRRTMHQCDQGRLVENMLALGGPGGGLGSLGIVDIDPASLINECLE